jgi:hypothetical protein
MVKVLDKRYFTCMYTYFHVKSVIDRIKYVFPSLTGKQTMTDTDLAGMADPIRLKIMEILRSEDRPVTL